MTRFAQVRYPWRAAVDLSDPAPARFYAALIGQAARFGMPARRRGVPLWKQLAWHGAPAGLVAGAVRLAPRRERPELDALVADLRAAGLLAEGDRPALLALERRAALTVFVFVAGTARLVAKLPAPGDERVDTEMRALEEARAAGVAPAPLGRAGEARVQAAIPGAPLRLAPLTPASAASLRWPAELGELAGALERLAATTRKDAPPDELGEPISAALGSGLLAAGARDALAAAHREVGAVRAAVLRNRDTSAQNCLFEAGRLTGIVDWEGAVTRGAPGFDLLNAALAYVEQGLALREWSQGAALAAGVAAWNGPFGAAARDHAAACAAAAGFPRELRDQLELAFLGWRVGRRLANPAFYPTTAATAAQMLEAAWTS